ncbi:hypothetical protein P3X46_023223 [Hevea brasiliensis]|uniref:DUF538 family protein n=1 Tax=Hevea brasiliensis TaxID=3981 RepID=A0ABQ9LDW7_HEVBR|nr:hypothetical protein P3X46_023223 [Hevea brasiliensis]
MEKALTKVGRFWISKKAKEEFSTISRDLFRVQPSPWAIPQKVKCYELDESKGKLIVYFGTACEVCFKDSSIIRYATRVKGTLSRGRLTGIEGMKTKVLAWVKVTSVTVESYKSDKILFTAGVKKSRPKDAYELPREAIQVEEF